MTLLLILFSLACDNFACNTLEFTGPGGIVRYSTLDWANNNYWVDSSQTCTVSPCTVNIPDPGELHVAFIIEGEDEMRVIE